MSLSEMRFGMAVRCLTVLLATWASASCTSGDASSATAPPPPAVRLEFAPATLDLGTERSTEVTVRNVADAPVGPIQLVAGPVRDGGGSEIPGASLSATPQEIPTLPAGGEARVVLALDLPAGAEAGTYQVGLEARVEGVPVAALAVGFSVSPPPGPVLGSLRITGVTQLRMGEVAQFGVEATDTDGQPVPNPEVTWSVLPSGAGLITAEGRFVGYTTGTARVVATAGELADTLTLALTARGAPAGELQVVGRGPVTTRFTSDHWEFGTVAYTGTWGCRDLCGNTLYVWDISDPAAPMLTDSVRVDARVVNDVKVSATGDLAILTQEGSTDGLNGITLLDLADPLHPMIIMRFAPPELANGVHNVWIDGGYAYVAVDGDVASAGLKIIDVSQPANPRIVSSFYGGSSFVHDVYVRDGLAFLSHWWAGLIILDVGNGIAGGTPASPREVARIVLPGYRVHNAWYWPEGGYAFVGDEIGVPGTVRVIDVRDLRNPTEVARFSVADAAPHNFWVDETRQIAYFAWYERGLQAVDVSGDLLGQLERQGRSIASLQYGNGNFCFGGEGTCTWAPQLHNGLLFLSDLNTGLWVLRPSF